MDYPVRYSTFAFQDLSVILDYLSQFSHSAPQRFSKRLMEQIDRIKSMPFLYEAYRFAPQYRQMQIDKYVVLYKVNESKREILIYRILHGAQDIKNYL